jgi:uncharacterized RDD family membrane protein YckC
MDGASSRVAQVFVWKQGSAPDLSYARQVLSVVNPDAFSAVAGDNPPLQLFSIVGQWPEEPWPRVLQDIRSISAPGGVRWTDTTRYELQGWQGTDSRTGDKLFVATVYYKPGAVPPDVFRGVNVQPPSSAPEQSPYYSPYGQTGPLAWPSSQPPYGYPQYLNVPPGTIYGQPAAYPYGYNPAALTGPLPMITGVLPVVQSPAEPPQPTVPPDYSQFYAGFGVRLAATLIDFFLFSLLLLGTAAVIGFVNWLTNTRLPDNSNGWLAMLGPYICLDLIIFATYYVVSWSRYGQTWGKNLMGIRIVRVDGSPLRFGNALLRLFGYLVSTAIFGWGFLFVALDSRRQGLHDKMAETFVVPDKPPRPAPAGLQGYRASPDAAVTPAGGYALPAAPARGSQPPPLPDHGPTGTVDNGIGPKGNSSTDIDKVPVVLDKNGQIEANNGRGALTQAAQADTYATSNLPSGPLGPVTDVLRAQSERERPERASDAEKARGFFKAGITELERGVRRAHNLMDVEPGAARAAAMRFREALELVPAAVAYRYWHAVALRYSEGFEVASGEFSQVLELDPGHFEAQRQVAFGPRWHDAFAYPAWGSNGGLEPGAPLPDQVSALLSQPRRPGSRLVLLRDGTNKLVVALSRTRRDSWTHLPTAVMPAHIQLVLSRTPSGPIIAFYVVVQDDPDNPFKGETFLNPHDPGQPSDDACQLGQHVLEQLAQQDHTNLIFVDENDRLLLSRKLPFGAATQVNIARILYEVQGLPPQVMDPARFQQAAQWHMEHYSLDQVS